MRLCCRRLSILILACVGWGHSALSQEAEITDVSIGLGGTYKLGFWTPVRVTIKAGQSPIKGRLTITTRDGEGVQAAFRDDGDVIELPAGSETTISRSIKLGREQAEVIARFDGDGITVRHAKPAPLELDSDQTWLVQTGCPVGLAAVVEDAAVVTNIDDASTLPARWQGYEGVDLVLLTTSDLQVPSSLTDAQFEALRQWTLMGGRLILCVGANGAQLFGEGSRFTQFNPGEFVDVITIQGTALEAYARASQRLDAIQDESGQPVPIRMTLLDGLTGRIEVSDTAGGRERPMIVRSAYGLGRLDFVAVDIDQAPFNEWDGTAALLRELLDIEEAGANLRRAREGRGIVAHLGYDDIIGQLRAGLDQFTGVPLVAFSWVAGLIVIYILLIGPADYFFLKEVLRKLQWTWVTFPLVVLLFCGIAMALHVRWKTQQLRINQVDLVDVDLATSTVRGTTWAHVYSPRTTTYDVRHEVQFDDGIGDRHGESLLSWQGLPGDGLGGLSSTRPPLFPDTYSIAHQSVSTAIEGLPVPVDASRGLSARWWTETELEVDSNLHVDVDGLLRGEIVNPLPLTLTNCLILYENWAYRLERMQDELGPRARTQVRSARALNLNWRLTRRRVVDIKDVTTPWNQRSLEIPRIMEIMMFYDAAGGADYTRLRHRYQPYVDLTEHLSIGRAVLVGRSREPASRLVLGDDIDADHDDQHWTFYRILFPVKPQEKRR